MSNSEYVLSQTDIAREIAKYFNNPKQIMGLILASKKIHKTWLATYKKLLGVYKLQQAIFAPHYFPKNIKYNIDSRVEVVIFSDRVIGYIGIKQHLDNNFYHITVVFPEFPRIYLHYPLGKLAMFRGRSLQVDLIENDRVYSHTKKSKLDAIDMCKAIYCYFMEVNKQYSH